MRPRVMPLAAPRVVLPRAVVVALVDYRLANHVESDLAALALVETLLTTVNELPPFAALDEALEEFQSIGDLSLARAIARVALLRLAPSLGALR